MTFSSTTHRGLNSSTKRITYQPDRRLSSSRGFAPRAIEWCVHSGDAMTRSTLPSFFGKISVPEASLSRAVTTLPLAVGKLSSYVRVAMSQASTAPTISTPALLAPQLLPPPPQKRSMPLIAISSSRLRESPVANLRRPGCQVIHLTTSGFARRGYFGSPATEDLRVRREEPQQSARGSVRARARSGAPTA